MLRVVVEEPGRGGDVVKGDVERRQLPCSMPTVSGTTFFSENTFELRHAGLPARFRVV